MLAANRSLLPIWAWGMTLLLLLLLFLSAALFVLRLPAPQPTEEVVATAVSSIFLTVSAQATPPISPTVTLPTPTATPVRLPTTCATIRAQNPAALDGEYTLYLRGDGRFPLTLYCHDMATNPREYLTLPNSGGSANFALIAYPEGALVTHYQKVRLDPATLVVDVGDHTFTAAQTPLPGYNLIMAAALDDYPVLSSDYGRAQGCNRNVQGAPLGAANIDLTGTPLILANDVNFVTTGVVLGSPQVNISPDRRVVDLRVDGRCAQTSPVPSLRLVYVP